MPWTFRSGARIFSGHFSPFMCQATLVWPLYLNGEKGYSCTLKENWNVLNCGQALTSEIPQHCHGRPWIGRARPGEWGIDLRPFHHCFEFGVPVLSGHRQSGQVGQVVQCSGSTSLKGSATNQNAYNVSKAIVSTISCISNFKRFHRKWDVWAINSYRYYCVTNISINLISRFSTQQDLSGIQTLVADSFHCVHIGPVMSNCDPGGSLETCVSHCVCLGTGYRVPWNPMVHHEFPP
jgi:hypothetical protein